MICLKKINIEKHNFEEQYIYPWNLAVLSRSADAEACAAGLTRGCKQRPMVSKADAVTANTSAES